MGRRPRRRRRPGRPRPRLAGSPTIERSGSCSRSHRLPGQPVPPRTEATPLGPPPDCTTPTDQHVSRELCRGARSVRVSSRHRARIVTLRGLRFSHDSPRARAHGAADFTVARPPPRAGGEDGRVRWLEMPLEYPAGVVKEHTAVREAVGIFDVSHLGKASVTRPRRGGPRQRLPDQRPAPRSRPARRSTPCAATSDGGVVDDLIAYIHDDDDVLLIPNAANTAEVVRRSMAAAPEGVEVDRPARGVRRLAVQGTAQRRGARARSACPPATTTCRSSRPTADGGGGRLPHRVHRRARVRAGRRAATVPPRCGTRCSTRRRVRRHRCPCGLGARDTLRTEMGYPLHGQDISSTITPTRRGSAGRSAGRRSPSGARRPAAEKAAGPRGCCAAWSPPAAASRVPG